MPRTGLACGLMVLAALRSAAYGQTYEGLPRENAELQERVRTLEAALRAPAGPVPTNSRLALPAIIRALRGHVSACSDHDSRHDLCILDDPLAHSAGYGPLIQWTMMAALSASC